MATQENSKLIIDNQQLLNGDRLNIVALATNDAAPVGNANPLPVSLPSTAADAFGRLRVSEPLTLFDSSHRYRDNGLWAESTTGTASSAFNANAGLIEMTVGTDAGDEILRETLKVFAYQPGKSLLILNTFSMAAPKAGLRQRVGYFGTDNGMYIEQDGTTVNFVERTFVTGSVTEIRIPQASWNIDKLDGTGLSRVTLDLTKAQILWIDIEWLGLGTVRMGFVIDGKFIHCHSFHHANLIDSTYITTASLPLRYEITNTAATASPSLLKQVCSSAISEGGYELRGAQLAASTPITAPASLATAGTYYPVVSVRLKSAYLDAIAIVTALSILGTGTAIYSWRLEAGGALSGETWVSGGVNSGVEYALGGTSYTGGRILASGFLSSSNQASSTIDVLKEALFKFQLERDTFTGTSDVFSLVASSSTNSELIYGSLDWEEVSR
jgi:hypothetical protein